MMTLSHSTFRNALGHFRLQTPLYLTRLFSADTEPPSEGAPESTPSETTGAEFVDEELEKAALESQEQIVDSKAPYESDFPLHSPILLSEQSSQSRLERNQSLRKLIGNSEARKQPEKTDSEDEDTTEKGIDPDVGFAELGGYTSEVTTGLFDEQPMTLHPTRIFYPGQQYEPEDLHPFGVVRESWAPKRSRSVGRVHSQEAAKEKLDFKNLAFLNNYLSDAGLILSRRETQLSKQLQNRLEKSVKLAQALALLPVLDRRPEFKRRPRRMAEKDILH